MYTKYKFRDLLRKNLPLHKGGFLDCTITEKKNRVSTTVKSVMNTRYGAGDRTRTGTPSLAADFESATSTISSHRQVYTTLYIIVSKIASRNSADSADVAKSENFVCFRQMNYKPPRVGNVIKLRKAGSHKDVGSSFFVTILEIMLDK